MYHYCSVAMVTLLRIMVRGMSATYRLYNAIRRRMQIVVAEVAPADGPLALTRPT